MIVLPNDVQAIIASQFISACRTVFPQNNLPPTDAEALNENQACYRCDRLREKGLGVPERSIWAEFNYAPCRNVIIEVVHDRIWLVVTGKWDTDVRAEFNPGDPNTERAIAEFVTRVSKREFPADWMGV